MGMARTWSLPALDPLHGALRTPHRTAATVSTAWLAQLPSRAHSAALERASDCARRSLLVDKIADQDMLAFRALSDARAGVRSEKPPARRPMGDLSSRVAQERSADGNQCIAVRSTTGRGHALRRSLLPHFEICVRQLEAGRWCQA